MIFGSHPKKHIGEVVTITMLPKKVSDANNLFDALEKAGFSPIQSLLTFTDLTITVKSHKTRTAMVARIAQRHNCVANVRLYNHKANS